MEKMKGVAPKKNTPELVAGNKDVVAAARKMRKSGGICASDWTAAQGEGQKPRG